MENSSETCYPWISRDSSQNLTLHEVNNKLIERFLGGISYISLLIFVGLIGNFHVLYIFCRDYKSNTTYRVYVIFLSLLDVFNLAISAPMVLYYLLHPVIFQSDVFCKIFRFIMYFANVSSTCAVVAIALDRGRRTFSTQNLSFNVKQAKMLCFASLSFAVLLSLPAAFFYGVSEVPTGFNYLVGHRCLVDRTHVKYVVVFLIVQTTFFCIVSLAITITSALIGWRIYRYGYIISRSSHSSQGVLRDRRVARSTCTLIIVTMVYICSSLPHHILANMYFTSKTFDCDITFPQAVAFYTFIFSCYLNNALDPFIYGFRDNNFFEAIKRLYGFDG